MKTIMGKVTLEIDKQDPLVDEIVTIKVSGLESNQKVTVKAEITDNNNVYFSYGCFTAGTDGVVDLSRCPSESGTYTGLSPMGLFWSMQPAPGQPFGIHLRCRNASFPFVYIIGVYEGHIDLENNYSSVSIRFCTAEIRRWYMAKGVQRNLVRSGNIRGALFLPPGPGPFPGVIDLFGSVGSLVDFRGALLASKGFAVLVLPYFGYEDLPTSLGDVRFEYFMEAVDWLSNNKFVNPDNLGVMGISKGGEIALQMAYYSPKIKAVVSINGLPYLTGYPMEFGNERIGQCEMRYENYDYTEEGLAFKTAFYCKPDKYLPLWEKNVQVLLVVGGDDHCVDCKTLQEYRDLFPANRRHLCELLYYEGAGHLIDPPYSPLFRSTRRYMSIDPSDPTKREEIILFWGGQKVQHAHAQEDSWKRVTGFFRKHLHPKSKTGQILQCVPKL